MIITAMQKCIIQKILLIKKNKYLILLNLFNYKKKLINESKFNKFMLF